MLDIRRYPILLFSIMGLFLFVTVGASTFYAEERATTVKISLPGDDCQTIPLESWTPQEQWVWEQVCAGKTANFNLAKGYGGSLNPKKPKGWLENRILSPAFLEAILLYEPYRKALTRCGVQIIGAWFKESVDLSNAYLSHQLCLCNSRFDSDVYLSRLRTPFSISLAGSKFKGKLDMDSIYVESSLFMRAGAEFDKGVILRSAKIGSQLDMSGSKFKGKLDMDGINITGSLFMKDGAEFDKEVILLIAKIGSQLDMSGSKFKGKLNMDGINITDSLFMKDEAEFDKEVILLVAEIGEQLDISGAKFKGKLNMDGINITGSLFMGAGAEFDKGVILRSAKIGSLLVMANSKFRDKLEMDKLDVESSLFMRAGAEFDKEVILRSTKIGGQLYISGSKFKGKLRMDGINITGSLYIRDEAEFDKEVILLSVEIGKQLVMANSKFKDKLCMENIRVEGNLFIGRGGSFAEDVCLAFSKIGSNLEISNGKFSSLDLTGTQIDKEFCLKSIKHQAPKWQPGSKLTLQNTQVGTMRDSEDAWPDTLILDGFTYTRLGEYASDRANSIATRDISWFKEWLRKDVRYSPQPYQQLASVLQKEGYKDKATEILYEAKRREHLEETSMLSLTWYWLLPQWLLIGYGYYNFRATYWLLFFCLLGTSILHISGKDKANKMKYWGLAYSLDMLLPIIKLYQPNYSINLGGKAKVYFYIHKICGYVLVFFFVAGLSGLTK